MARATRRFGQLYADGRDARAAAASIEAVTDPGETPRIVIDGVVFQSPLEGIARVWSHLIAEWAGTEFATHVTLLDRGGTAPRHPGYRYLDLPKAHARDSKAQRKLLEAVCRAERADLFVSTLYTFPVTTPSLLMVHDLTPEILGWDTSLPEWREISKAIEYASAYLCVSQNTADDLVRLHPSASSKPIAVARLAADDSFASRPVAEVEGFRSRLGLPERYFVFVGHRDNHKNGALVFDALSLLPPDLDVGLMAVGGAPALESRYAALAGDTTVRVARLSDDDLRVAYSGAAALLYPSRYEGFGLPILEAMRAGAPVITAATSSIPEVAGDAAVYVDTDDPAELAQAMQRVLDPEVRADLVARGAEQVARFSWSRTADIARAAILRAAQPDARSAGA